MKPSLSPTTVHAGTLAPPFSLPDQHGVQTDSAKLLLRGPVVLFFFRALWCDYCKLELEAVERNANLLRQRGGILVGITRYQSDDRDIVALVDSVSFPILNDQAGAVVSAFGLRRVVPADVAIAHGSDWAPIPARFVIAPSGVVTYGDADPDYTIRPDAAELAPVISRIVGSKF